jgi:hypothetical protein
MSGDGSELVELCLAEVHLGHRTRRAALGLLDEDSAEPLSNLPGGKGGSCGWLSGEPYGRLPCLRGPTASPPDLLADFDPSLLLLCPLRLLQTPANVLSQPVRSLSSTSLQLLLYSVYDSPLAAMAAPLPASRISSLTSSTLPLILERQRSLSLNLSPSPFTESTILKNLALLTAGVRVLELEGKGVRVGAGKQVGQEDASRLREGVEKLLALMEGDAEGRQKVAAIRESFQSVFRSCSAGSSCFTHSRLISSVAPPTFPCSPPRTPSPPPQEPVFALASPTLPPAGLSRASSPPPASDPLSRPAAGGFQESYRDDEDDEPYRDVSDADMLQQQQQMMEGAADVMPPRQ